MQETLAGPSNEDQLVDAVLTASRVLVAIAARSLADVGEEVTLTQYRSLVVLASRVLRAWPHWPRRCRSRRPPRRGCATGWSRKVSSPAGRTAGTGARSAIALSPGGRRLVDTVTARRRQEIEQLVASIPAESRTGVVAALGHLSQTAGEVPEQDWSTGWDL